MLPFILLGILLVFIIVAKLLLAFKEKGNAVYESRVKLMSKAEIAFFNALKGALPLEHYHIHSKTRMADIVDVKKGMDRKQWRSAFNKIEAKHVDFVLSNPIDSTIHTVVELD
ncbi:uncharacterized protein METZ01_LOCUS491697, partial [marine metagenome]